VLAYGLGDLQDAGLLPGHAWLAFDLTAHVDPGSWWVSIITGITALSPKMTALQATAWLAYLAVVIPAFVTAGRAPALAAAGTGAGTGAGTRAGTRAGARAESGGGAGSDAGGGGNGRWKRLAEGRPWAVAGVLVAVPALVAATTVAALPASHAAAAAVTVTRAGCARDWAAAGAGTQTFTVTNQSGLAGEITLVDASGAIAGEIETLGPGTSAPLTATLGNGTYTFECRMGSQAVTSSQPVQVTATTKGTGPVAVKPVTVAELAGPNQRYQAYAAAQLAGLAQAVARIQADLRRDDRAAAERDWLTAQLDWERVGASYNSFGDLGAAVDGLPGGAGDTNVTGLHRLEYGLWHGQSAAELLPVTAALARDVASVRRSLASDDLAGDPASLPVRAHEILEDALRDHLSGMDDEGGGAAYAQTYADLQVTREVLGYLAPLITARQPGLVATVNSQLDTLQRVLLATQANGNWRSPPTAPRSAREDADSAIGVLLESLATVPDLLEIPPTH
jgi:high-affinity iron transporter